jgi:hypothetical protein
MNSESTARTQSEPFTPNGKRWGWSEPARKRVPIMLKLIRCGGTVSRDRKTARRVSSFAEPRIPECPADVERAGRQMEAAEDSGGSQEL